MTTDDTATNGATEQPSNHWSAYGIRQGKKRAFLINYVQTGSVTAAADAAHVARCRHYEWLHEDADYATAFSDAQDRYVEKLEREADRRAVDGTDKPVIYQGAITGTYKEYSDNLLMFRLKGLAPNKYRERVQTELSGPGGGPVVTTDLASVAQLSDEDLALYERLCERIARPAASEPGPSQG